MAIDVMASIREKIRSGALPLPSEPSAKRWVGNSTRRPCDGCEQLITPDQIEHEVDISRKLLRFDSTRRVSPRGTKCAQSGSPTKPPGQRSRRTKSKPTCAGFRASSNFREASIVAGHVAAPQVFALLRNERPPS